MVSNSINKAKLPLTIHLISSVSVLSPLRIYYVSLHFFPFLNQISLWFIMFIFSFFFRKANFDLFIIFRDFYNQSILAVTLVNSCIALCFFVSFMRYPNKQIKSFSARKSCPIFTKQNKKHNSTVYLKIKMSQPSWNLCQKCKVGLFRNYCICYV